MAAQFFRCGTCGVFFVTVEAFVHHTCGSTSCQSLQSCTEGSEADNQCSAAETPSLPMPTDTEVAADVNGNEAAATHWSHDATLLLIERYRELQHVFKSSVYKKMDAWKKVADAMKDKGYCFTGDQCDKKMRSLKYRHKLICDGNNLTGRGRRRWEFFDAMDDLQAGNPSVRPIRTMSTLSVNEDDSTSRFETQPNQRPSETSVRADVNPSSQATSQAKKTNNVSQFDIKDQCVKKKKRNEPPSWFSEFVQSQNNHLEELKKIQRESIEVARERTDVLKKPTDALLKS